MIAKTDLTRRSFFKRSTQGAAALLGVAIGAKVAGGVIAPDELTLTVGDFTYPKYVEKTLTGTIRVMRDGEPLRYLKCVGSTKYREGWGVQASRDNKTWIDLAPREPDTPREGCDCVLTTRLNGSDWREFTIPLPDSRVVGWRIG